MTVIAVTAPVDQRPVRIHQHPNLLPLCLPSPVAFLEPGIGLFQFGQHQPGDLHEADLGLLLQRYQDVFYTPVVSIFPHAYQQFAVRSLFFQEPVLFERGVEGLAQAIVKNDVPETLKDKQVDKAVGVILARLKEELSVEQRG